MIDLARGNPVVPAGDRARADRRARRDPARRVHRRRCAGDRCAGSTTSATLMGDLGLPGSVVEMPDAGAQKALWDVRKAGLNIMMSLRGDGKPVSFIEDCAVPLAASRRIRRPPDAGVPPPRHARHVVRARVGRNAARAADPRHAPRRRREDARDRRGGERRSCANTRARSPASTATASCAANGSRGSSARGSRARSRRSRTCSIRRA